MNGYEYRDVNYPEEKYEDKEFTEDELYDAIAYAFNDGYYGAVNKAYEWVRENWRNYINVDKLESSRFCIYNKHINGDIEKDVASHLVINKHIEKFKKDYRFEVDKHPIEDLQDRKEDNISVGRPQNC